MGNLAITVLAKAIDCKGDLSLQEMAQARSGVFDWGVEVSQCVSYCEFHKLHEDEQDCRESADRAWKDLQAWDRVIDARLASLADRTGWAFVEEYLEDELGQDRWAIDTESARKRHETPKWRRFAGDVAALVSHIR